MQRRTQQPQPRTAQAAESAAEPHSPLHHTRKMSAQFSQLIDHLRRDVGVVDEPQFRAMCETAADVMGGLVTAFRRYEQKREAA
jgi:hypothetical protein